MTTHPAPGRLAAFSLSDKYRQQHGHVFMSGNQALVRLPIQQRLRDQLAGLDTAGFISGYRGSPLGRFDMDLWQAGELLREHHIHFQPGVNEDLAATAVWGSQYVPILPKARHDGVFGIWYGKGPGVDRSGDALKHANAAGTSPRGGVLALAGDDHAAKSSTQAHQSDYAFIAAGIPVLYPADVQEILDYGLHGIAMSRHAGCWVALKVVTDVVEGSAPVRVDPALPQIRLPDADAGDVHIKRFEPAPSQEARLYTRRLPAALAYARANGLNRIVADAPGATLGIVTAGKSYGDTRQALAALGLDDAALRARGVRLLKVAMVWPLDPQAILDFAQGLDRIVVIEEKRPLLEEQIKSILFDAARTRRPPEVIGKFAGAGIWSPGAGAPVLSMVGELNPGAIAACLADALSLPLPAAALAPARPAAPATVERAPTFCSGCPHSTSTRVPEGSMALAGIGCHSIALLLDPVRTGPISHMGAEGAMWVGQAPFTDEPHVFANIGDGTYFHSGFLAIRQAVAAKVSITYKLLLNGFVSMTGGQPIEGELTPAQLAAELHAEGVARVVVVTDDPGKYTRQTLPHGVPVFHRERLDAVQKALRAQPGVSVLIYDQMCATERRRQRKRGRLPDPPRRTFIHAAVCEGCGDCGAQSNCLSLEPVETEFGRKRRINQASCNKDFSCVQGFCPSFVTVRGGKPRRAVAAGAPAAPAPDSLPEPRLPSLDSPQGLIVTGIGGTGVITVGAIVSTAAHLDGICATSLDLTGLAQKYGAVMSHIRLARHAEQLHSYRLASGEADVVLGCDLVVTASPEALERMRAGHTRVVVNTEVSPTRDFARNPDWHADAPQLLRRIADAAGTVDSLPVTSLALALLGDPLAANLFVLGFAWQHGWIAISRQAIERAITVNGAGVEQNLAAFGWGRLAAHDRARVERAALPASVVALPARRLERLDAIVAHRTAQLTAYQDAAYAQRYQALVARIAAKAGGIAGGEALAKAVARHYYKLLAYKDEYEVARLYADPAFRQQLDAAFEGPYRLSLHLGAGPFARRDPDSPVPRKREVGPWILPLMGVLARLRRLRGTWLDPFRHGAERRLALAQIRLYEADMARIAAELDPARLAIAVEIAGLPDAVRGYGHVRERAAQAVAARREALWRQWETETEPAGRAAA
ncbi:MULTISPECIES: indolepyruvate ferredoxin oxidoreductase family protein [Cupriavidus]